MTGAPELFETDRAWIVNETRANNAEFSTTEGTGDSFEVDGATIWYDVQRS